MVIYFNRTEFEFCQDLGFSPLLIPENQSKNNYLLETSDWCQSSTINNISFVLSSPPDTSAGENNTSFNSLLSTDNKTAHAPCSCVGDNKTCRAKNFSAVPKINTQWLPLSPKYLFHLVNIKNCKLLQPNTIN